MLIASEDDRSPVLQIWDLRNAFAPVKELSGHQKGILSASWCPNDSNLLLSSAKDNRTLCWDPNAGEILCELPAGQNWTFDVNWSPCIPAILSCSSFDGDISVFSLQDSGSVGGLSADGYNKAGAAGPMRAPKWLKRPCGASFAFGGKIAVFGEGRGTSVDVMSVVTDKEMMERAGQLQAALESQDLSAYCAMKVGAAERAEATAGDAGAGNKGRDKTEWSLMQVLCSGQDQRRHLLSFLGVEPTEPAGGRLPSPPTTVAVNSAVSDEDPTALFSQLAIATEAAEEASVAAFGAAEASEASEGKDATAYAFFEGQPSPLREGIQPPISGADASLLSRAILTGDIETAVDACMRNGRVADALVLAASGGPELWTVTRDRYLDSAATPLMRKMTAVVHQDFVRYVSLAVQG